MMERVPESVCTEPDLVTLFSGWTRLSTAPHGDIPGGRLQGFFAAGTCLVDYYRWTVNGLAPRCTLGAQLSSNEWAGVFVVPGSVREGRLPGGSIPEGSLDVTVRRVLDGSWTEALTVRNHSHRPRTITLALEWNSPLMDARTREGAKDAPWRMARGISPKVNWREGIPRFHYLRSFGVRRRAATEELRAALGSAAPKDGDPVKRGLEIRLRADPEAGVDATVQGRARTKLSFRIPLPARGSFKLEMEWRPAVDGVVLSRTSRPCPPILERTHIRTGNDTINRILARADEDLVSLSLPELIPQEAGAEPVPACLSAGVPRYIGVFGRDLLTAGWQASVVSPRYLEDAVSRAALYLGVRDNDWRDEEEGRILHERRANPDAAAGRSNRELYYGDVAATPFWIVKLASAFNWNGNRDFLRRHARTLEACTGWMERKLREGGGFLYYQSRSSEPNRNQGWKDSDDAIVDAQGRLHEPPLALAEVQGYCFLALLGAAELALASGRRARARELYREGTELRRRFNRDYWNERERFFAMALDREGRQVEGIGSNAGHCLGCGIIDQEKAPLVARRLLAGDMFSGWGIRTLSTENPAYDPFSYHRGSVWPVENSTICAGLRLCGFDDEATRVIGAQLAAAATCPALRLPEVLSGHARTAETPIPGLYPEANLLQAWSVSAVFFFLWVLLGLRPVAPLRTLLLKPYLPPWLPWVEIRDLEVGSARVSLAFHRTDRGGVRWSVLEKEGRLLVLEQPLELDPSATIGKRLRDAVRSVI
jgi:glycogen debranching enzyme